MTNKPDIMTVEQAEAVLTGLLKIGCARRKAAAGGVLANLISPPDTQAGPTGPMVTNPLWGAAQGGLIGAGIGGVAGAGRALFDKERRKRILQEALQGAVLGGGIGGGGAGLWHAGKYLSNYKGPVKPRAGTRGEEIGNAYSEGGIPGATAAIANQAGELINSTPGVNRIVNATPRDPETQALGAGVGAGIGGTVGFIGGGAIDRARSDAAQNRPVTDAINNHARDMRAYNRLMASPEHPRQPIHSLALSGAPADANLRRLLQAPATQSSTLIGPPNPRPRVDILSNSTSPNVTAAELGLTPTEFATIRQRVSPAPTLTPGQPLATAPRRFAGRGYGTAGLGLLGAILGSQRLSTPTVGYGH